MSTSADKIDAMLQQVQDEERRRHLKASKPAKPALPPPEFFTVQETAEILKVHHNTIRNWVDRGILKCLRLGGVIRVPAAAIEALAK